MRVLSQILWNWHCILLGGALALLLPSSALPNWYVLGGAIVGTFVASIVLVVVADRRSVR